MTSVSRETLAALTGSLDQYLRLRELADWLAQSASPLGLTNFPDSSALLTHAVAPAFALPSLLGHAVIGSWAELGPASGALGIALALTQPAAHIDLVDRRDRVTAFLDLTLHRLALPNATARAARLSATTHTPAWTGVCFRALSETHTALRTAAAHAQRWICAWHSASAAGYDLPPPGFACVARCGTLSENLVATLYCREGPTC